MSVGLGITLSQDIQASNLVCRPIVETVNTGITSGEYKRSEPPC